jgi:hypothetical protein
VFMAMSCMSTMTPLSLSADGFSFQDIASVIEVHVIGMQKCGME